MKNKIKFGTDGFRGIIGKDFTETTVQIITKAIAQYLQKGTVVVGYDPRLDADKYAKFCSNILANYGFDVILSNRVVPTPVIALMSKKTLNSAGAIMFTASHNPKEYLGIKFIPNYGGPATSDITREIENIIEDKIFDLDEKDGSVIKKDFFDDY